MRSLELFVSVVLGLILSHYSCVTADCVDTSPKPFRIPLSNCTIPPSLNFPNGIDSWGVQVNIAGQELCAVPSGVVNNTVITETEICTTDHTSGEDLAQCNSRRGGTFNFDVSTSSYSNISLRFLAPDPVWDSFNPPFGGAGNATIQFASDISLPNFPIAIALEGQNLNANQLGLGNDSVLLHSFVSSRMTSSMSFGLFAGSQSISRPRDGHIVFGGFDATFIDGPFTNYSMSDTKIAGNRVCSLEIIVQQLTLRRPGVANDVQLISEATPMPSCIEPYDNLFRFPSTVLDEFQRSTNWINDSSLVSPDLYVVEPGLYYNTSFDGSLIFTLQNGLEVEIPAYEMAGPLRGINPNGQRVLQNNVTTVNIFNQKAPQDTASLGKLYLTVNYHAKQFQLARVVPVNDLSTDLRAIDSSDSAKCSSGHSVTGVEIGVIVVGSILAIILILVLLLWIKKGRPLLKELREKSLNEAPPTMDGLILSNLKEDVGALRRRVDDLANGGVGIPELGQTRSQETGFSAHRPSVASIELPSPTDRTRMPSIPDR